MNGEWEWGKASSLSCVHREMARLLVEAGGAELVRAGDDTNRTALHDACRNGHLEVARLLVEAGGAELVRAVDDMNYTALHGACQNGQLELARLLVETGGAEMVRAVGVRNVTALLKDAFREHTKTTLAARQQ
jgi:ankyrin repeat protein